MTGRVWQWADAFFVTLTASGELSFSDKKTEFSNVFARVFQRLPFFDVFTIRPGVLATGHWLSCFVRHIGRKSDGSRLAVG